VNSLQNDTKYVLLDYNNDTFNSLEQKINNLNISTFTNVALMAHSYPNETTYKMIEQQQIESIIYDVQNLDSNLTTWKEIIDFWNSLVSTYNIEFIDYLGCAILSDPNWNYIIFDQLDGLDVHCPARFRASNNNTGNEDGSDWILESDGVNVKDIYFTDGILEWPHSLYNLYRIHDINNLILTTLPGKVITWGTNTNGGNIYIPNDISNNITANIKYISRTQGAFAALDINNNIVATWGENVNGGNILFPNFYGTTLSYNDLRNISQISDTFGAFAVIQNGAVKAWGGGTNFGASAANLAIFFDVRSNVSSNVTKIFHSENSYAAIKNDGSVYTWGRVTLQNQNVNTQLRGNLDSNVVNVYNNRGAFAALRSNGSVFTWGPSSSGGSLTVPNDIRANVSSNVVKIFATSPAFAALTINGEVLAWGQSNVGGNLQFPFNIQNEVASNVIDIFNTHYAFAALKDTGNIVVWGDPLNGGNIYFPQDISTQLSSNIVHVYSSGRCFAALKNDGNVATWGGRNNFDGGNVNFPTPNTDIELRNIVRIYGTFNDTAGINSAMAAITKTGKVIAWGGGNINGINGACGGNLQYPNDIRANVSSNIVSITATESGFAALKDDGSVYVWGLSGNNNTFPSDIRSEISSNITSIYTTVNSYCAIKSSPNYINTGLYTDQEKIDILKGFNNRRMVLDTNVTITGNVEINKNLINNKKYKLINYKDTNKNLTFSDVNRRFYIPMLDGDRITIDGNIYTSYNDRLYVERNNLLERVRGNVILFGKEYKLDAGSIIGYNSEELGSVSNIVINPILNGFIYSFTPVDGALGYKLYYTPNIVGGSTTILNISGNSGSILNLNNIEYLVRISAYDDLDENISSNISVIPQPTENIYNSMKYLYTSYVSKKPEPGPTSLSIQQYAKRLSQKLSNIGNQYQINGLIFDAKGTNEYINKFP
jgi:alpha-tubulin suppressor-like RCC1 family protein